MARCILFQGHLDVKYKLQNNKDAEVFRINMRNLANGQLHKVNIKRQADILHVQVLHYILLTVILIVSVNCGVSILNTSLMCEEAKVYKAEVVSARMSCIK